MQPLPTVAPSCSLSDPELREQLARYRVLGDGAQVVDWDAQHRTIRVAESIPEPLIQRVLEVEQACCPFYKLSWDRDSRRLTLAVMTVDHEPALDALTYALGVQRPA